MKNLNIILAAVGGALVGASLGILFAPDKGSNTRAQIKDYLKTHFPKLRKDKAKLDAMVDEIAADIREAE